MQTYTYVFDMQRHRVDKLVQWRSASSAADPAPSVDSIWATEDHTLPLLDRVHLRLAFGSQEITSAMSAVSLRLLSVPKSCWPTYAPRLARR